METLERSKTETKVNKTFNTSGSLAVIDALLSEKVTTIFGYPGGAIMPVYDALFDFKEKLNHILVRHEQGAKRTRRNQFSYWFSRCFNRFYTISLYYWSSFCTSFRNRCISRNRYH
jgi:Thiamine pyrophosphate enzyme, N-terminal TPP binding domain